MLTAFVHLSIVANVAASLYIAAGLVQYYLNHR